MEKQSYLPIKFRHKNGITDYEKTKNYSGDVALPKFPFIGFPGFQLVLPDESYLTDWVLGNFRIDLVAYDSGNDWSVLAFDIKVPVLYDAGDFWVYVLDTFPWESMPTNIELENGRFYYRVGYYSEDDLEVEWESEVFEMCDLELDAMTEAFTNVDIATFNSTYFGGLGAEYVEAEWCEDGGGGGQTAVMPIECFPGEEFDVYVREMLHDGTPVCEEVSWINGVALNIRGIISGDVFSNTITVLGSTNSTHTRLSVMGGTGSIIEEMEMVLEIIDNDTKGKLEIWIQRTWKADHIQLRYFNSKNFCKIVYEDDYETRMFLNAKQVIDNNQLEETTVEDDESNKYRIIGTIQKWNSIQFAGGESLLNAMSLLRLHDDITIVQESGEPMDVVEVILEQTIRDDYTVIIKLVYREDSCSWTSCEFTTA